MWWRVPLEIACCLLVAVAGNGFWSMLLSPRHIRSILSDPAELRRLAQHIGREQLLQEASQVRPLHGSYEKNLVFLATANAMTNKLLRWLFGAISLLSTVCSYFLGVWYFAITAACFLLTFMGGVNSTIRNRNATHVHEFMIVVRKWHETDPDDCARYCCCTVQALEQLYAAVIAIDAQVAAAGSAATEEEPRGSD